ncbi:Leucine Rich Repeat [Seminavis robusta]|uniref:Leucine Rich Repeat n=1 Tax=Seminavis robusta TaxID=568900 RepID=A0A9N8DFZ0_9STRA|nr:Leucine Rich Repeat [Seminavis robusta]|eukprot:Sro106_g053670.1 Leucine Rich Repeat (636) ;mRNA; r:109895-112209
MGKEDNNTIEKTQLKTTVSSEEETDANASIKDDNCLCENMGIAEALKTQQQQLAEEAPSCDHPSESFVASSIASIEPLPAGPSLSRGVQLSRRQQRQGVGPGAFFTNSHNGHLTPAGKTPINVLGAELRMANKPGLTIHHASQGRRQTSESTSEETTATSVEIPSNHVGLSVANPVDESAEQERDLPLAEEYDPEEHKTIALSSVSSKEGHLPLPPWLACVMGVVLVATITMVVVFVGNDNVESPSPERTDPLGDSGQALPEELPLKEHVLMLLPESTASHVQQDKDSPQAKAYNWVLEDPRVSQYEDDRIQQRYALATLYFATDGDLWTHNDNWLAEPTNECNWYMRPAFAMKDLISHIYRGYLHEMEHPPTACNDNGQLEHLWLDFNNLAGSIPPELYMLTHLKTLSYGVNSLQGTIATEIGKLTDLEGYELAKHRNGGVVPTEFGLLKKLRALVLSDNNHQGSIPSEIWQLTNLETILMSRNHDLRGTLPSVLGTFRKLRWINFEDSDLTGTIPSEVGQVESLEVIAVGGNSEFGLLSSMGRLDLGSNSLSGTLPDELSSLQQSLYTLNVAGNELLSGTIPDEVCSLNGTCLPNPVVPCIGSGGFQFDCSSRLCGCGCTACNANSHDTGHDT